jgi:hypothetical protein
VLCSLDPTGREEVATDIKGDSNRTLMSERERLLAYSPRSFGLSATSQQYFSLRTNKPPTTS